MLGRAGVLSPLLVPVVRHVDSIVQVALALGVHPDTSWVLSEEFLGAIAAFSARAKMRRVEYGSAAGGWAAV